MMLRLAQIRPLYSRSSSSSLEGLLLPRTSSLLVVYLAWSEPTSGELRIRLRIFHAHERLVSVARGESWLKQSLLTRGSYLDGAAS